MMGALCSTNRSQFFFEPSQALAQELHWAFTAALRQGSVAMAILLKRRTSYRPRQSHFQSNSDAQIRIK